MYGIKVRIRNRLDGEHVECILTDFDGQTHCFHGPLSHFTTEFSPMIPGDGVIRCMLRQETPRFAEVDTYLPDCVESTMGQTQFRVPLTELVDNV